MPKFRVYRYYRAVIGYEIEAEDADDALSLAIHKDEPGKVVEPLEMCADSLSNIEVWPHDRPHDGDPLALWED